LGGKFFSLSNLKLKTNFMKKTLLLLVGIAFLTSCSSHLSITKRRYNKGFYIAKSDKSKPSHVVKHPMAKHIEAVISTATEEVKTSNAANCQSPIETKTITYQTANHLNESSLVSSIQQAVHKKRTINTNSFKEKKASIRVSQDQIWKRPANHSKQADTNTILLVILAIFIPCLAVFLHDDKINKWFWITLILQILLVTWIVASAIAILHILGKI